MANRACARVAATAKKTMGLAPRRPHAGAGEGKSGKAETTARCGSGRRRGAWGRWRGQAEMASTMRASAAREATPAPYANTMGASHLGAPMSAAAPRLAHEHQAAS